MPPKFRVGDHVRPRLEWRTDPNRIPTGRIVRIEPFGDDGAIYVEGERRAFAAYVFELVPTSRAPRLKR